MGYRHYTTRLLPTLFPFGHGLSYTTFAYSDLSFNSTPGVLSPPAKLKFTVRVENTGSYTASEVIQVYVSPPVTTAVFRPALELQAFQKVQNLRPGESREVRFELDKYAVSYWDDAQQKWVAEAGEYGVHVAASVEDIRLRGSFKVVDTFTWEGL